MLIRDFILYLKGKITKSRVNTEKYSEFVNQGYTRLSTSNVFNDKYLIPIILFLIYSIYIFSDSRNITEGLGYKLPFFIILVAIYFLIIARFKDIFYGNNKIIIINTFKKKISIVKKSDIDFIEKKGKTIFSDNYYLIYYFENNKTKKVSFLPEEEKEEIIIGLEKDIDENKGDNEQEIGV